MKKKLGALMLTTTMLFSLVGCSEAIDLNYPDTEDSAEDSSSSEDDSAEDSSTSDDSTEDSSTSENDSAEDSSTLPDEDEDTDKDKDSDKDSSKDNSSKDSSSTNSSSSKHDTDYEKFDGNYTADIDLTDLFVQSLEAEIGTDSDFEWSGSVVMPYHLELSEGEYTLSLDGETTIESLKTFIGDNIEAYITALLEEELESSGITLDDALKSYGYSSIWEIMGYDSKEAFLEDMMAEIDLSDLDETEEGEYEIDGDSITLEDVEIVNDNGEKEKGWVLTYEDGKLSGVISTDDLGIDDIDETIDVIFLPD